MCTGFLKCHTIEWIVQLYNSRCLKLTCYVYVPSTIQYMCGHVSSGTTQWTTVNLNIRSFTKEGFIAGFPVIELALSWLDRFPSILDTLYVCLERPLISLRHPLFHCWTVNEPKGLAMKQNQKKERVSRAVSALKRFLNHRSSSIVFIRGHSFSCLPLAAFNVKSSRGPTSPICSPPPVSNWKVRVCRTAAGVLDPLQIHFCSLNHWVFSEALTQPVLWEAVPLGEGYGGA